MDWNKPYHSESGNTTIHGSIVGQSFTPTHIKKETKKGESFLSRLKKPFMPTTWKWFRTSGPAKVYEYQPRLGETTKLNLNLPRQFWPFLVDSQGIPFQTTGSTIAITMDDSDYLEMGSRQTVAMQDADTEETKSVTFPTLRFTQEGKLYQLDWNKFARERKVAYGAYDEDWGYSRAGQPTHGEASMYDRTLDLIWNNKFQWWWILLGILGFFGLVKWMQRR